MTISDRVGSRGRRCLNMEGVWQDQYPYRSEYQVARLGIWH